MPFPDGDRNRMENLAEKYRLGLFLDSRYFTVIIDTRQSFEVAFAI